MFTLTFLALCTLAVSPEPAAAPHGASVVESKVAEPTEPETIAVGPHKFVSASQPFIDQMLDAHNQVRVRYEMPPMRWDLDLAAAAQIHAEFLAKTAMFEHANQSKHGENLWMGSAGHYPLEAMVAMWANEDRMFRKGRFPDVSITDSWSDIGHFTQMIWPSTTHVGCAAVRQIPDDYLVCRYSPPGNVIGQSLGQ